ncbi:protein-disulfide reductase DsbD N-terminal domain-containing protein [Sinomicrobium kalidii]|uniref:protein-disulfide reductase DsbD domain-containing protein n=1 Tax=Sinomicrobium kalidii TaxID=2900738 RepID=UPI001E4103C8|nr:protein-disulfide reductase DsbD domain-containing protein [Sinomicrobium kalidii]UGU15475.1 protein-disulfide reductase DsbD N-terminal domain-containing protein [Sinomicrobium kalidii]
MNMRKMMILCFLSVSLGINAQILNPVKWSTNVTRISDSEFELIATAEMEPGWHLYSQSVPEGGPVATQFSYEGNGRYLKKGNTSEGEGHTIHDPVFDMEIKYFENKAYFKQRIKSKTDEAFKINASVRFMLCDDTQCLPPKEVDLIFEINK